MNIYNTCTCTCCLHLCLCVCVRHYYMLFGFFIILIGFRFEHLFVIYHPRHTRLYMCISYVCVCVYACINLYTIRKYYILPSSVSVCLCYVFMLIYSVYFALSYSCISADTHVYIYARMCTYVTIAKYACIVCIDERYISMFSYNTSYINHFTYIS